jgi:nicotinamidase-related amidase
MNSSIQNAIPFATLVLVDMRKINLPNGLTRKKAYTVVQNCRAALCVARQLGLPVAHVRNALGSEQTGNESICGFEPQASEAVLERRGPSCYSSPYFADVIRQTSGVTFIAGFFGDGGALATIADAVQTLDHMTLLWDASLDDVSTPVFSGPILSLCQRYTQFRFDVCPTAAWLKSVETYYAARPSIGG